MEMKNEKFWSLVGIPDHTAVANLGGRLGSAHAPKAFRSQFQRLNGRRPVQSTLTDFGDSSVHPSDIKKNHLAASEKISNAQQNSRVTVVIGGSHDHGYSHLLGVTKSFSKKEIKIGCINIDAHLDVRKPEPVMTSGSPFYVAIEEKIIDSKNFIEFGIQKHCNSSELWDFVEKNQIEVIEYDQLRKNQSTPLFSKCLNQLSNRCDVIVISLDIDAASSAYAPGVSAPQSEGLSATDLLEIMDLIGENPKVISLGIFELNPFHDIDQRTARLCATCVYHFIDRKMIALGSEAS